MELKSFLPEHGEIFSQYQSHSELAHSGFQPHLIWSDLIEYRWAVFDEMFYLFATSSAMTHLALAPLGLGPIEPATAQAFEVMACMNPSHIASRIDNVDESTALRLSKAGYAIEKTSADYLYRREEVVKLSGRRFHSQRAEANQAARLQPVLRPFTPSDIESCLAVFDLWAANPTADSFNLGNVPCEMMREDARFAHHAAMRQYRELGLTGRVVEVEKRIAGYTFGFPLSQDIFCVLLEITSRSRRPDRSIRGLSAWLFRAFCRELQSYTFINTMDDSGLPGLSRAKTLWHPVRMVPSYTVRL